MAFHTGRRIDPAIYLMLAEVIPTVWQCPLGGVLVLIARLELIFMGMTVRAKRFLVADRAGLVLLLCKEPMARQKITRMVQCRLSILVTVAAQGSDRHFNGVLHRSTGRMGAGIETEEHHED